MGQFRVVLEATGGHGCQREVKDGGLVFGCRRMDCPDCLTAEFVEKMSKIASGVKAELIHWPGQTSEVTDEFVVTSVKWVKSESPYDKDGGYISQTPVHRIRHGSF